MLEGEPFAGAAHAALHLVQHQQPVMLVADLAQLLQVMDVQRADAAFALDRLDQHRNHVAVVLGNLADRFQIVVGHAHEAADQRLETGLHLAVAGGGKGRQRAPVEGLFHHDDRGGFDALLMAVHPCQLDCGLVCLAAGIAEERFRHVGQAAQLVGQQFLFAHLIDVGAVDQLADLFAQCGGEARVRVAQRVHGDAGQCVEITFAFGVPQPRTFAMRKGDGEPGISVHHMRHTKFLTGMAMMPPMIINSPCPFPLSNFPPQAGERANESLREFHVK